MFYTNTRSPVNPGSIPSAERVPGSPEPRGAPAPDDGPCLRAIKDLFSEGRLDGSLGEVVYFPAQELKTPQELSHVGLKGRDLRLGVVTSGRPDGSSTRPQELAPRPGAKRANFLIQFLFNRHGPTLSPWLARVNPFPIRTASPAKGYFPSTRIPVFRCILLKNRRGSYPCSNSRSSRLSP